MMPRTKPEFRSLIEAQSLHSLLFPFKASPIDSHHRAFNAFWTAVCAKAVPSVESLLTVLDQHEETEESLKSTHLQRRHESVARLCDAGTATLPECVTSSANRSEDPFQLIQFCSEALEDTEPINFFPAASSASFTSVATLNTIFPFCANRIEATSRSRRQCSAVRYLGQTPQRDTATGDQRRDKHYADCRR